MSDVDYGGATVFTQMGVTLRPKRGAAAFWYNLFRNGEGDEMTRHAACPVLAGSKWGESSRVINVNSYSQFQYRSS